MSPMSAQKPVTFYNNQGCPYSHRVHIALQELGIPFNEVKVNLDGPMEPWYLNINPRGVGPAIKFINESSGQEEVLTESSIIVYFLSDTRPSQLLPASNQDALFRARANVFVDTWNTKVAHFVYTLFRTENEAEKEALSNIWVATVQKEIEPLLDNAAPFFGGSHHLTVVETIIAPFLIRIWALSNGDILPLSVKEGLMNLPNFSAWAQAIVMHPSVLAAWDEEAVVNRMSQRIATMKARSFRYRNGTTRSYSSDYFSLGTNGVVTPAS